MADFLTKAICIVDEQVRFVEEQILISQKAANCSYHQKKEKLKWTGAVVSFVELCYALEAVGCINAGSITLKKMFDVLSDIFDIEVKEFSRTFIDVKNRVKDRTSFLDELKRALIERIEKAEEKPSRK